MGTRGVQFSEHPFRVGQAPRDLIHALPHPGSQGRDNSGSIRSPGRGLLKYVATICGLLANTIYLLYLLVLWLFVRMVRRLKAYTRQQRLMHEVRRDNLMPKI